MMLKRKTRGKGADQAEVVLRALRQAKRPLSAYEIISALRGRVTLAPPTVYRALDRLIEERLAHRLESLNAFTACTHEAHHEGVAFAICDDCGSVTEFSLPKVERSLEEWSRRKKFALNAAVVELHGICETCHESGKGQQSHV